MRKICVLLMMFILISLSYAGVLSSVKGEISDSKKKVKIEKVKITIESLRVKTIKYTLYTDSKGGFYKTGLQPGVYAITYEKEGYIPKRKVVRIGIAETVDLSNSLDAIKSATNAPKNKNREAINALNKGKYDSALKLFTELSNNNPKNPVYYFYIGLINEKLKNYDKAIEFYKKSLEIKKDFSFSLQKLGTLYAKKGDFKKAINFYKKAIDAGSGDIDIYYNYGVCQINLGDSIKAKDYMEKVIKLDPGYADAYYQLGLIYLNLGDMGKAKEFLNKFIKMDPKNKNVQLAQQILKSLK